MIHQIFGLFFDESAGFVEGAKDAEGGIKEEWVRGAEGTFSVDL